MIKTYLDIHAESEEHISFSHIQGMLMVMWKYIFDISGNRKFTVKITHLRIDEHDVKSLKDLRVPNADSPTNL